MVELRATYGEKAGFGERASLGRRVCLGCERGTRERLDFVSRKERLRNYAESPAPDSSGTTLLL